MIVEVECRCGAAKEFECEYITGEAGVGYPDGWYVIGDYDQPCGEVVAFARAPVDRGVGGIEYVECEYEISCDAVVDAAVFKCEIEGPEPY